MKSGHLENDPVTLPESAFLEESTDGVVYKIFPYMRPYMRLKHQEKVKTIDRIKFEGKKGTMTMRLVSCWQKTT